MMPFPLIKGYTRRSMFSQFDRQNSVSRMGQIDQNSTKRGIITAFSSEHSQSKPEKRPENRSKFSHCLLTRLQRVAKYPSVGAKSVSFANEGPDNQRQSEQNQSVGSKKQGLTQPKRQNSASEQIQSLIVCLPLQVKVTIHKQRLWQIMQ